MPLTNIFNHVLENLCFQEHKSGIRRKHDKYIDKVAEDRVLRNTCKRGPPDRPNRPTGPRHRHTNIRDHQADTRRKAVARGAKVGPAEPMVWPNPPWFPVRCILAGDQVLSSRGRLGMFPCKELAGTDLKYYIRGLSPLSLTHTPLEGLSHTLSCDLYSLG